MRKYAGFAFVACVLAAAQLAGTQGAQSPSADAPVVLDHPLHFDVDLVQVDAVVEDRSGHRPADLKESGRQMAGELMVNREGAEVFRQSVPVNDGTVEGTYRPGSDAAAGQYVLRVSVAQGSGKKVRLATEWTTFTVVPQ